MYGLTAKLSVARLNICQILMRYSIANCLTIDKYAERFAGQKFSLVVKGFREVNLAVRWVQLFFLIRICIVFLSTIRVPL